jgi:hypothetical protein
MGDIRCNVWEISTLSTRCYLNHVILALRLKLIDTPKQKVQKLGSYSYFQASIRADLSSITR